MKYILLHGLGQSASSWDKTVQKMDVFGEILCPELSKWLESGRVDYSSLYSGLEQYCAQIEEPLNLCGLSLGGILALQYGIEHPDRVHSLVLIGTQYVMPKGLLKFQNVLFQLMPKRVFQGMGFEKRDWIKLSNSMLDLDFRAGIGRLLCPVLVVCGEKDKANREASIQMSEQISNAELWMVPGAGHEVNRDTPETLGERLNLFWRLESEI